ncbi:MAG: rhodanese-related sulfurtransferase [Synechococcaceae cyanobacterium ELA263]
MRVVSFYRFVPFALAELPLWRRRLLALGQSVDLRGTVLLAEEGINGTVSGEEAAVAALVALLRGDPRLAELELKNSEAPGPVFHRFKVRIKREIVTLGRPELGLAQQAPVGTYVEPGDWNALIRDPGTLVIDTRNAYEVALGSFERAIDPGTTNFHDFPDWVEQELRPLVQQQRPRALALFCTGGIRCEKATAWLLRQGFEGVHHLRGGILRYLEEVPEADSSWRGDCFVFDQRVALNHRLEPGDHSLCHGCRMPLSAVDRSHASYVPGVSCPHCQRERGEADRARFAERQHQVSLASARGDRHIGQVFGSEVAPIAPAATAIGSTPELP